MDLDFWKGKRRKRKYFFDHKATIIGTLCISILVLLRSASAVDEQGEALLSWKATLAGAPSKMSNWNLDDPSPCRWYGVSCGADDKVLKLNIEHVQLVGGVPSNLSALTSLTSLVVSGANLSGPIPPQLGSSLPALTELDLSGNALTGKIPPQLFHPATKLERVSLNTNKLHGPIPDSIGHAVSLRFLVLYDNQLDGVVPPSIGRLGALRVLRAGGNKKLHGSLPPEIGDCGNLIMLGLADTSISGPLPPELGKLKKLQTLAIYTALLSGPIPSEIGECKELQNIYLYENSLSGSIPPELGNLNNLTNLLVWQNNFVGIIPPEIGSCSELTLIDLSMNGLYGEIPKTFGYLPRLQELQLSMNKITGPIPAILANCSNITDLELDNNLIEGTIPSELGRLKNLRILYLWQNNLEGGIPPEIGDCGHLEAIDLSQNSLTGAIPKGIFRLPLLNKLLLLTNNLSGSLPTEIGNCSSLVRFRANENRIAGAIPSEIGMLKRLSFLDLGDNRISGVLPLEISGCSNLTFLDLHSNQIDGTILPDAMSHLASLQFLDLSDNSISGTLERSGIGSLTSLTKLILANNKFTGNIPSDIGSCVKLQLLDLGRNLFSGPIPPSIGKISDLEIALNLSWNNLSGEIPPEFSSLGRLGVLDLSHNRLTGDLHHLSSLQNLVALNISYNDFSGRLPYGPFFSKLPVSNLVGNPSLCISQMCSGSSDRNFTGVGTRKAARIATTVLLTVACALLVAALLVLVAKKRAMGAHESETEADEVEMGPPWEVTLYQKMDISVADVAKNLTPANVIGKGWSGTVYRATVPSGVTIAVKKFRTSDDAAVAAFGCEIEALARARHRNIIRLLGWGASRKTRLLFYHYLPHGTLGVVLHGGGAALEWETRLDVALGLAEGLAYLHHDCVPPILHRDVKPDNILLGERYEACLADFGLACVVNDDGLVDRSHNNPPNLAGSYGYMAPEYGCMMRIGRKSDVYSYGVVLLELITGKKAVDGSSFGEGQGVVGWAREHLRRKRDPVEIIDERMRGRTNTQVQGMLQVLGIALLCCSMRAEDRPSMKDVAALLQEIGQDSRSDAAGDAAKKRTGSDSWRRGGMPEQQHQLELQQGSSTPFSTSDSYNFNL